MSVFAVLHAAMIMYGVKRAFLQEPIAAIVQPYDMLTRASAVYPFFGAVGDGEVVRMRAEEKGHEIIEKSEDEWGRELRARLNLSQIPLLDLYRADELLGRIFAVDFFERRPCTKKVTFALARYHVPSMNAYVKGQRPSERIIYEATFIPAKPFRSRASCALD